METKTGAIIQLNEHGFGFIKTEEQEENIFFHCSSVRNASFSNLKVGNKVEFIVVDTKKGMTAELVVVV